MTKSQWERFQETYFNNRELGFALDISRMDIGATDIQKFVPRLQSGLSQMTQLEEGAIANPDEKRMVGHYWLRAPQLAPKREISLEIEQTLLAIKDFASKVHTGQIAPERGERFEWFGTWTAVCNSSVGKRNRCAYDLFF